MKIIITICCVFLLALFLFLPRINFKTLFAANYQKSLVDASPLAALSGEQANRLEDFIKESADELKDYYFIEQFKIIKEIPDRQHHKICSFMYFRGNITYGLNVRIWFYHKEQTTVEPMCVLAVEKCTFVRNDNGTEAILYHSYIQQRNLFSPYPDRSTRSKIRLGNAIISLWEIQRQDLLDFSASSHFIKWLSEKLAEFQE